MWHISLKIVNQFTNIICTLNCYKHTNSALFGAHQSLNESLCRIRPPSLYLWRLWRFSVLRPNRERKLAPSALDWYLLQTGQNQTSLLFKNWSSSWWICCKFYNTNQSLSTSLEEVNFVYHFEFQVVAQVLLLCRSHLKGRGPRIICSYKLCHVLMPISII